MLKPNIREKGTLIVKVLLGEPGLKKKGTLLWFLWVQGFGTLVYRSFMAFRLEGSWRGSFGLKVHGFRVHPQGPDAELGV